MAEQRRVQLNLFGGESAHQLPAVGRITSRSINWIPSQEGKLTTYRGAKKVLSPEDATPGNPGNNGPTAWDDKYVKNAMFFTDTLGLRRLVVHVSDKVYNVEGNNAILLFKYPSEIDTDDGVHNVFFIEHQNHVVILHPNFPPLKWGGDEPVSWLGVRDIPTQPDVHVAKNWSKYFESDKAWGIGTVDYKPPVAVQHDDAADPITRARKYKCAFMNSRGQIGRWGAESYVEFVPTSGNQLNRVHPIVEWRRPVDQGPDWMNPAAVGNPTGNGTDITHVVLAASNNAWPEPDAAEFFIHDIYPFTMNRVTDQKSDAALVTIIDEDNYPPLNASFGCTYKDTLLISGNLEDPYGVWWSKPGFMESFPPLNYYKAGSAVTAVLPLSDRVVVVTKESIEVLRQDQNGFFGLFRKEDKKGSSLGNSLVEYKGSIFGIFNGGFGIFDGFAYKGMSDEFGELFDMISVANNDRIRSYTDSYGRYWIAVDYADSAGDSGLGSLFVYDFTFNAWFRVDEDATCIFEEDGDVYAGGRDNFSLLDASTGGTEHVLELAPTFMEKQNPQFGLLHKEVMNLYVRISSTGDYTGSVELYADEMLVEPVATGEFSTRLGRPGLTDSDLDSVWDESILDSDARWDAPRYQWQKVVLDNPVEFYSIRIKIKIPANAYAEISGIAMDIHVEDVQTPI